MELYSSNNNYKLYRGNMLDMLDAIEPESIDSIITDPPYELNFMNKGWDNSGIAFQSNTWDKCYQVLKPGGYLLVFGGTRTFHRIACAIEDAGFEIRDTIMWLYGSGFPKSMNIGKAIDKKLGNERIKTGNIIHHAQKGVAVAEQRGAIGGGAFGQETYEEETIGTGPWEGWGSALKPAFEPIIVARKPFKGSLIDNIIKYEIGGINIDECRVPFNGDSWKAQKSEKTSRAFQSEETTTANGYVEANENGRFPANVILTYDETDYEEVCGGFPNTNERYFYCAKASSKDRDEGLNEFEIKSHAEINNRKEGSAGTTRQYGGKTNPFLSVSCPRKNIHPTVKPTELMQYLVRLVSPKGATILDPFNGSGSTGKAVMYENRENDKNYKYVGIELTDEYLPIAKARIEYVINLKKEDKQLTLFDL